MASQVESLKYVPGTNLNVDGFRFIRPGCRHFFLTHCHSDHTVGLSKSFDAGVIYCSPVSARLLVRDMGLRAGLVCPLQLHVAVEIAGVRVTPLPANHCPGAVMFLFIVPGSGGQPPQARGTPSVLHTGDMRWADEEMMRQPALRAMHGQLDILILDTTYCAPRWCFPPQSDVLDAAAAWVRDESAAALGRVLAVASSYHIGKERFYFGLAQRLGCRLYCIPAKRRLLGWLDLPSSWMALLTDDPCDADVHVMGPGEKLTPESLETRLRVPGSPWARVVGFRATGWSFKRGAGELSVWREGAAAVIGAPYSEHSSWTDLRACVASLRPRRIVPSVNAADSTKARAIVDCFVDLMDVSRDRSRLHAYFRAAKDSVARVWKAGPGAVHAPGVLGAGARGRGERQGAGSSAAKPKPRSGLETEGTAAWTEPDLACLPWEHSGAAAGAKPESDVEWGQSDDADEDMCPRDALATPASRRPRPLEHDIDFDLESVDQEEQRRILQGIEAMRRKRPCAGTLVQGSLERFFPAPGRVAPPAVKLESGEGP